MSINKVDYEVLTTGVTEYSKQAGLIQEALDGLIAMNVQLVDGWTNETADAFMERFTDEYKPALTNIIEAVQSLSVYINDYMQARQDDDTAGANAIRK